MGQSFILEVHIDLAEYKTLDADGGIEAHRSWVHPVQVPLQSAIVAP